MVFGVMENSSTVSTVRTRTTCVCFDLTKMLILPHSTQHAADTQMQALPQREERDPIEKPLNSSFCAFERRKCAPALYHTCRHDAGQYTAVVRVAMQTRAVAHVQTQLVGGHTQAFRFSRRQDAVSV